MNNITAFSLGATVRVGPEDDTFSATVIGIAFDNEGLSYHVGWWNGRERVTTWLPFFEVQPYGRKKEIQIGFNGTSDT